MASEIKPKPVRTLSGAVKTTTGSPLAGVMVIGSDLNYVETDANGCFELKNADSTLIFWCAGFRPRPMLTPLASEPFEVVLSAL